MPDFNPFDSGAATALAAPPAPREPAMPKEGSSAGQATTPKPDGGAFNPFDGGRATETLSSTPAAGPDPHAHWRNVYGGLDGLDKRLDGEQRRAFTALDYVSPDPQEARAKAINQTFIAEHMGVPAASLASNWGAVKSQFAKSELDIDAKEPTDKNLYDWIGLRLGKGKAADLPDGELKAWGWQDTLKSDYYGAEKNLGKFWDWFSAQPLDKIPDAPKDLPDVWLPVPGMGYYNPAVAAGVYNGAIKPFLAGSTSLFGIATFGVGSKLEALREAYPLAKTAIAGMAGTFSAWMGWSAARQGMEAKRVLDDPNASTQDKVTAVSGAVSDAIQATMGVLGTAFVLMPKRAPALAKAMEGKKPSEVAEVLKQEAMTAEPEAADALNQAAAHFDELGLNENFGTSAEGIGVGKGGLERIAAAAIKLDDGTVTEGPSHDAIRNELMALDTVPLKEGESVKMVEGKPVVTPPSAQEGFVTSAGRFVDRTEARELAEDAGQVVSEEKGELHSHQIDMSRPRSAFSETALKNSYGELERDAYGFPEAPPTEQRAMAERWTRAGEVLAKDPEAGARLADQLKRNPNLGLSDDQSALLLRHKVGLERAMNEAADAVADPNIPPAVKVEAQKQVGELSNQLLSLLDAVNKRGSEWGREGRWRQALAREDYSLATQETLLRAKKGGAELTEAERTGLQERIKALEAKRAELEAHVAQLTSVSHTEAVDRAVREMSRPSPRGPRPFRAAESIRVKLHAKADESRRFLAGKLFTIGPDVIYHMSVIGADQLYSTGLDFAKWSAVMVKELGEKARPALAEVWEASKKLFHAENRAGLIAELGAKQGDEQRKALYGVAQELARAKIEEGTKGRDAVVDSVFEDVKRAMPDVSRREVMDAISGYGRYKPLTHDQITDELRDIKGQLQQVAKLEDLAAGEKPKKTGIERREPTEEEKALAKQVAGAAKMEKVTPTPPPPQVGEMGKVPPEKFELPAAMEFGKTQEEITAQATQQLKERLAEQIKSLEKQIETRTKTVRERKGVVYDDEADRLKARRDELKEQFDAIFGRKEISDEQRLNIWKAHAQRRIIELTERLAQKDFEPTPKRPPPPMDEEGIRIKSELERIKQDFEIEREKARLEARPRWQKVMGEVSALARAGAISGYHTLAKLAMFSLGRFAEAPITEAVGAAIRRIPGVRSIAAQANFEAGQEYEGIARFFSEAATKGMRDAWETLTTGKSNIKAELGEHRWNVQPIRWYDYFGISHMAEKSPLLRGDFELRKLKAFQHAIANGLWDGKDELIGGAIRHDAFAYAQRAILQENNTFAAWINSLSHRLEQANPKTGKEDITKVALSTFIKTFLTKGIVRTPANYIMQTLERTPLGFAKGTAQAVVAHIQGVDKLTNEEANVIMRLLKVGAVGSAMFLWGVIDATKKPKDRIFGGYYQPGEKRDPDDVPWGKSRIGGFELSHLLSHNPLLESAQMGTTFMRVAKSKLRKKDAQDKGALAGAVFTIMALASEAPVANPITRNVQTIERGEAQKILWDQAAGLVPMLVQNIAVDLDDGKSRRPETFGQAMELTIPGARENVPETKAQKVKDMKEKARKRQKGDGFK